MTTPRARSAPTAAHPGAGGPPAPSTALDRPRSGGEAAALLAHAERRLVEELAAAAGFAEQGMAASTRRAYAGDWQRFRAWCAELGVPALPAAPAAVAAFLAAEAGRGRGSATLTRRLAAIRAAHLHAGLEPPSASEAVRQTLRGIRRARGRAPVRKAPATDAVVRRMADACDPHALQGRRDRALLLLGFAGAFRRAELVALRVEDLEDVPPRAATPRLPASPGGLRVRVRRSKTDQEGAGAVVPVLRGTADAGRYCPVAAVRDWLRAAAIADGPVFRALWKGGRRVRATPLGAGAVAAIVKAYAARIGEDPAAFAGHSLRAGFLTSAAGRGATLWKMREVSRHRSVDVLAGYVRDAEAFVGHAGEGLL